MICAGDSLSEGGETEVEVAIVGAGPIGVAVAIRLAGRVGRIALIDLVTRNLNPLRAAHFLRRRR